MNNVLLMNNYCFSRYIIKENECNLYIVKLDYVLALKISIYCEIPFLFGRSVRQLYSYTLEDCFAKYSLIERIEKIVFRLDKDKTLKHDLSVRTASETRVLHLFGYQPWDIKKLIKLFPAIIELN